MMLYLETFIWVTLGLFVILGGAQKIPSKVMQEKFNSISVVPIVWWKYLGFILIVNGILKLFRIM